MKVVATIEARMTSSRLPGKPLLLANNKSMLEHLSSRLKTAETKIAVAELDITTKSDTTHTH